MPAATKTRTAAGPSIGSLIDQLWELRDTKRALEAKVKEIEERFNEVDEQLMAQLEAAGLDKATGKHASVSYSTSVVGTIEDFDALWAYARKNNYSHLFQRRLSDVAYRELLEAGKKVPGVQPFTKKRINLRALTA